MVRGARTASDQGRDAEHLRTGSRRPSLDPFELLARTGTLSLGMVRGAGTASDQDRDAGHLRAGSRRPSLDRFELLARAGTLSLDMVRATRSPSVAPRTVGDRASGHRRKNRPGWIPQLIVDPCESDDAQPEIAATGNSNHPLLPGNRRNRSKRRLRATWRAARATQTGRPLSTHRGGARLWRRGPVPAPYGYGGRGRVSANRPGDANAVWDSVRGATGNSDD